jgi:hypothetical protein
MKTPEQESPIIYKSGMSPGLGAGWDVMLVVQRKGSVALARGANGTIIRKIDSVPERWEVVRDEGTLRACRECFDDRDRPREQKAMAEDDSNDAS